MQFEKTKYWYVVKDTEVALVSSKLVKNDGWYQTLYFAASLYCRLKASGHISHYKHNTPKSALWQGLLIQHRDKSSNYIQQKI